MKLKYKEKGETSSSAQAAVVTKDTVRYVRETTGISIYHSRGSPFIFTDQSLAYIPRLIWRAYCESRGSENRLCQYLPITVRMCSNLLCEVVKVSRPIKVCKINVQRVTDSHFNETWNAQVEFYSEVSHKIARTRVRARP